MKCSCSFGAACGKKVRVPPGMLRRPNFVFLVDAAARQDAHLPPSFGFTGGFGRGMGMPCVLGSSGEREMLFEGIWKTVGYEFQVGDPLLDIMWGVRLSNQRDALRRHISGGWLVNYKLPR